MPAQPQTPDPPPGPMFGAALGWCIYLALATFALANSFQMSSLAVLCAPRSDDTDARDSLAAQGSEREHPLRWLTSDSRGRQW